MFTAVVKLPANDDAGFRSGNMVVHEARTMLSSVHDQNSLCIRLWQSAEPRFWKKLSLPSFGWLAFMDGSLKLNLIIPPVALG
jgi:hypothetical protein